MEEIAQDEIQEILSHIDILDYISQYCDFEKHAGEWYALSPLKEERTPSFTVNEEKQRFYDFSSGANGNLINFVRAYNHCGFHEAIEILKQYANITDSKVLNSLPAARIARKYRQAKPTIKQSTVKILPDDCMDRFEFNEEALKLWVDEGISYETMHHFGVSFDVFSHRIVLPIKDYNGKIINISGRTTDPDYKAKGLRKYTYFYPLGTLDTLYGFSDNKEEILKKKEIILFEGAKSVMLASEWGVNNCAAILTSHLNPNQLRFLIKLSVKVVFALDEDVDIRTDENIKKLKRYVTVYWAKNRDNLLGSKMSPVDNGFEIWKSIYERRELL